MRAIACLLVMMSCPLLAQDVLTLEDGSALEYYLALPDEAATAPLPLVVFMGGGSGNKPISFYVYRFYARDLADLGWAVAVPVSPDNRSFRGNTVEKVRQLIASLQAREDIGDGKTVLAGISAGGMSALEIARLHPQDIAGVLAIPAIVRDEANAEGLRDMPIYLRIGSEDELGWASRFTETVNLLEGAGARLDADILYGAPHMFGLDWEVVRPWLDSVRP
ncbi:MAG: hypothetical protein RLZZ385_957 [Pseudomonadota bacterium]|jgi:dienelactone hydrolase